MEELENARLRADSLDMLSTVVKAVETKAKLSGLMIAKQEVAVTVDASARFSHCDTATAVARTLLAEYAEGGEYDFSEADEDALIALIIQNISATIEALEPYRIGGYGVDHPGVTGGDSPTDIRAQEMKARWAEERRQRLLADGR